MYLEIIQRNVKVVHRSVSTKTHRPRLSFCHLRVTIVPGCYQINIICDLAFTSLHTTMPETGFGQFSRSYASVRILIYKTLVSLDTDDKGTPTSILSVTIEAIVNHCLTL